MHTTPDIKIKSIRQLDERTLSITWTDERQDTLDVVQLRRKCPCAVCIDEWTRKPILRPEDVADSVRPTKIESVGSYALKIFFNDAHSTGIYTFPLLRSLNELN